MYKPVRLLLALSLLSALSQRPGQRIAFAARQAGLERLNKEFAGLDSNGDGQAEIHWVNSAGPDRNAHGRCIGSVLLIVEPRLVGETCGLRNDKLVSLRPALSTYANDLAREGWRVLVVTMQVYAGTSHQDGRTLLAMRRYVRRAREVVPDLTGVILIGSFPEAMLVRQYNWRQHTETVFNKGKPDEESFGGKRVHRLRSVAEMIAFRSDLPLADLDGRWEEAYHQRSENLASTLAIYPNSVLPPGEDPEGEWLLGGSTKYYETGTDRYEDFFFINDGHYASNPLPEGGTDLKPLDALRDEECSEADRHRANPLACPAVLVSRINAKHIALKPKSRVCGTHGEGLLAESGLPQEVTFATEKSTPGGVGVWERDPRLERRLLIDYFDRNHRYRCGQFQNQFRPAAISYGLGSAMPELLAASPRWKDFNDRGYDLQDDEASLVAAVQWLKRPARLRFIAAHSDPWGCNFKKTEDVAALEKECGGQPWSWIRRGNQLVPTLGATGKLDFAILRTLWQNDALPDQACFYLHSGCEAIAPGGAMRFPYNHPEYAYWQGAEALLFYGKGLALVGRSKVFYDFPTDFAKLLGEGKTFGEAWAHYFEVESAESDVRKVGGGIGRKRAYFWGVLGDWTLRLTQDQTR
ncbi:MAG: hypothetical protein HY318_04645 [Armatimonadetes bacterium]|nr:hypothetical protein [Armatimonadota bacterium]